MMTSVVHSKIIRCMVLATVLILNFILMTTQHVLRLCKTSSVCATRCMEQEVGNQGKLSSVPARVPRRRHRGGAGHKVRVRPEAPRCSFRPEARGARPGSAPRRASANPACEALRSMRSTAPCHPGTQNLQAAVSSHADESAARMSATTSSMVVCKFLSITYRKKYLITDCLVALLH